MVTVTVEYSGKGIDPKVDAQLCRLARVGEVSAGFSFGVRDIDFLLPKAEVRNFKRRVYYYAAKAGLNVKVAV